MRVIYLHFLTADIFIVLQENIKNIKMETESKLLFKYYFRI